MCNFFKACSYDELLSLLRSLCGGFGCYGGRFFSQTVEF